MARQGVPAGSEPFANARPAKGLGFIPGRGTGERFSSKGFRRGQSPLQMPGRQRVLDSLQGGGLVKGSTCKGYGGVRAFRKSWYILSLIFCFLSPIMHFWKANANF